MLLFMESLTMDICCSPSLINIYKQYFENELFPSGVSFDMSFGIATFMKYIYFIYIYIYIEMSSRLISTVIYLILFT